MLARFLLLLTILGPGNSLQLWDAWGHGTKEASGPVHVRERRQEVEEDDYEDYDNTLYNTDPPEMLINVTNTVDAHLALLTTMAMLEQRVSGETGTSETATLKVATTDPAGPDAGGPAVGMLSTESAPQWHLTTVEMTIQSASPEAETTQPASPEAETTQPASPEAETTQPASPEVETSQPAPTEAETSKPAPTEAETSQPAPTEAGASQPAPTEAGTSQPAPTEAGASQPAPTEAGASQSAPTEAGTSQPASTEAGASQPAPTEAGTSQPAPTEAETTQLPRIQVVESLFTTSAATEAPSTEPTAVETVSTESNESTIFLGPSVTDKDNGVHISHLPDIGLKKGLIVTPGSSLAPTPSDTSDLIPVKQCLLAILILASLATVFLVCTVVLAVRLSRKTHMYPVRTYSPTEMVCISSLLPEGGDGAPVTANGGLPKVRDLKAEPSGDRDGDDLTLQSFLP